MTVDEFIAWAGDDRWQLVDGEPRAMVPASATHGIIQANVGFTFIRHLRDAGSPCRTVTEPAIVPRVRSRSNMRVPDVAVTCSDVNAGQIALPEPLLIVEILSPTNELTPGKMSGPMCRSRASRRYWSCDQLRSQRICCGVTRMAPGPKSRSKSREAIRCIWKASA